MDENRHGRQSFAPNVHIPEGGANEKTLGQQPLRWAVAQEARYHAGLRAAETGGEGGNGVGVALQLTCGLSTRAGGLDQPIQGFRGDIEQRLGRGEPAWIAVRVFEFNAEAPVQSVHIAGIGREKRLGKIRMQPEFRTAQRGQALDQEMAGKVEFRPGAAVIVKQLQCWGRQGGIGPCYGHAGQRNTEMPAEILGDAVRDLRVWAQIEARGIAERFGIAGQGLAVF